MKWIKFPENEPKVESETIFKDFSNSILVYSKKCNCWFEALYNFKTKTFTTLESNRDLDSYNITHFCQNIPLPIV